MTTSSKANPSAANGKAAQARRLRSKQRRELFSGLFFKRATWRKQLIQYFTLLCLSIIIASAGLLVDSTAVVIAAMLVAPLMTPILGIAAAIVMGLPFRQLQQLALVIASTLAAVAIGFLIPWLFNVPHDVTLPNEVLARTRPGLADLVVALSAGFVAAFIHVNRDALSALSGVAIAVSLVPPLSACGVLLYFREPDLAARAFLLYFTNFAVIVLTACVVFIVAGVRARARNPAMHVTTVSGVLLAAFLVLTAAMPLISHTRENLKQIRERLLTVDAIQALDDQGVIEIVSIEFREEMIDIVIMLDVPMATASQPGMTVSELVPPEMSLARVQQSIAERLERDVEIRVRGNFRFSASTL